MGLFFEDKKEIKLGPEKRRGSGFFEKLFFVVLDVIIAIGAYIAKTATTNFVSMVKYAWQGREGASEKRRSLGKLVAVAMVVTPLYLIYLIPAVRDMTLSKNHTVNLHQAAGTAEIAFPSNEYFKVTDERERFFLEQSPTITYIKFSRDSENIILRPDVGQCLLVPRGKIVDIRSNNWPIYAVGFENTVRYRLKGNHLTNSSVQDTSDQISIRLNPLYTSDSWAVFYSNWGNLQKVNGRNLPFSIEAKSDENAMICF
jgi:hypothetical protein